MVRLARDIEVVVLAFEDFLTHSCTIQLPGETEIGKDAWNRPMYGKKPLIKNVPCRFITKKKNVVSLDGSESIYETSLLLLPDQETDSQMQVSNIKDEKERLLSDKKFEVDELIPRYKLSELMNYKAVLRGSD